MWADAAGALAHAFLAGEWDRAGLIARGREALRGRTRWMGRLVGEVLAAYHRPLRDRPRELAAFIEIVFDEMWDRDLPVPAEPRPRRWFVAEPEMGVRRWPVPEIATTAFLADHLGLNVDTLLWLADRRGLERTVADERLHNYRYRWTARANGAPRVIEQPKPRLRDVQRRILREILDAIPPAEAVHGFRRGRSARTHAAAHTGQRVVIRLDLEDFFAAVTAPRVFGMFREIGYPETVAHLLTGLCTNVVPREEWERVPPPAAHLKAHQRLGRRLATPHLPQGAPTSPALANLAAYRLDQRISGLAGELRATYTRYADDLALSGDERLLARAAAVRVSVNTIAGEEGFRVNDAKTGVMPSAVSQRVCGIVVNAHPNLARREYDRLKAILHDAARRGPEAANRRGVADFRAHLLGRIAWAEHLNPARGARLRARFEEIRWEEPP
jgi:hypothetical protein